MKCTIAHFEDVDVDSDQNIFGIMEKRIPVECGGDIISDTHYPDDDSCYVTIYCNRCRVNYERIPEESE